MTFLFQGENQESYEGQGGYDGDFGGEEPPFDDVLGALHQRALNATGSVRIEIFGNENLIELARIFRSYGNKLLQCGIMTQYFWTEKVTFS